MPLKKGKSQKVVSENWNADSRRKGSHGSRLSLYLVSKWLFTIAEDIQLATAPNVR